MKVIIAGSRNGVGELDIANVLDRVAYFEYPFPITEVVCGEAKGVDLHGRRWAEHCRIPVASFPADWEREGKSAGHIRNRRMAEYADALIAFSHNESKGTEGMIAIAEKKKMPCVIIRTYSEPQAQKSPREEA